MTFSKRTYIYISIGCILIVGIIAAIATHFGTRDGEDNSITDHGVVHEGDGCRKFVFHLLFIISHCITSGAVIGKRLEKLVCLIEGVENAQIIILRKHLK